jgi:rhodanese-related sulfurtransferase
LPKDINAVAYCRGPYCVLSTEAVAIWKKVGIIAILLEEGLPDWKPAGLPAEEELIEEY